MTIKMTKTTLLKTGFLIGFSLLLFGFNQNASANPVVGFEAGRIMDDIVMSNHQSMTVAQIQAFLNSKVPVCDTWGTMGSTPTARRDYFISRGWPLPIICLKEYVENGKNSAQIIYDAAQEFKINPQVLIVLLQKEQGLVTDTWPDPTQYRSATGYGCPDGAPCDSQYFGLTNQIRWAARMFRAILNNSPTWYTPYLLGNNHIRYNPNTNCGGTTVNIQNRATQALYNYTPYQPNQAALNAGYGTGDACSAYGNRNFYLFFRDWFGDTILVIVGDITMTAFNGSLFQSHVGSDGRVYNRSSTNGQNWSPWTKETTNAYGEFTKTPITMTAFNGSLFQSHVGSDGRVYNRSSTNGQNWSPWTKETTNAY